MPLCRKSRVGKIGLAESWFGFSPRPSGARGGAIQLWFLHTLFGQHTMRLHSRVAGAAFSSRELSDPIQSLAAWWFLDGAKTTDIPCKAEVRETPWQPKHTEQSLQRQAHVQGPAPGSMGWWKPEFYQSSVFIEVFSIMYINLCLSSVRLKDGTQKVCLQIKR